LIQLVRHFTSELFPWAKEFSLADQRAFLLDVLQAVHSRNAQRLQECLEDWQATAKALHIQEFMQVWQQPYDPGDDVPWEQVRSELDLVRDPEAECS
jgi:hypothetical protein